MSQSTSHIAEQPELSAENADWRKEVDDLQKYLASEASKLMRSVPPKSRKAFEDLGELSPILLGKIQDLERLQQGRLDELSHCHEQWQTALSDRTGELGVLDIRVGEANDKIRQQQSELDVQMQRMRQEEAALDKRQVEADRTFTVTKANTTNAEQTLSGLAQESSRLETLKLELEAKERYQTSQTLTLAMHNSQLDQDVTDYKVKERKLTRDQKELKDREAILDRWKAYTEQRMAEEKAKSQEAVQDKETLSRANEDLRKQQELLGQQFDKASESLQTLTTSNQSLMQQLDDSQKEGNSLRSGMENMFVAILPEKEVQITNLKAELDREREQATTFQTSSAGRINSLERQKLELESKTREQSNQLSQLRQENSLLQAAVKKSEGEAELAEMKLALAQETIEPLNTAFEENVQLVIKNSELTAAVTNLTSEHSDVTQIRLQVLDLQRQNAELRPRKIEADRAKSLQDSIIGEVTVLREELGEPQPQCDRLRQERDRLRQERNGLRRERDDLREERDDLQQEREELQLRLQGLEAQVETDLDAQITTIAGKNQTIHHLQDRVDSAEQDLENVHDECNRLFAENIRLTAEVARLNKDLADMAVHRDHLLNTVNETQVELHSLTAQLQSCHCSDETSSRKRTHRQMVAGGEEASPASRSEGTVPESVVNLDAAGPSSGEEPVQDPGHEVSSPTVLSTHGTRSLMNTAAPRALGTTNATIVRSESSAFVLSVRDAKLLNFSSDVLPHEVLQALRRRFGDWNSRPRFNWDTVQSLVWGRSCIEARLDKRKSSWDDGPLYACALCERKRRLCMVVESAERVLLLPRKVAEDEGVGPTDPYHWTK